jgi:hypothetical protein
MLYLEAPRYFSPPTSNNGILWFTSEPAEDPNHALTCLLSHLFMAFASRYVARDNVSPGATPDAPEIIDEIINILFTLLSFETFDTLAGSTRSIEEVSPLVKRLARATLALNNQ